LPGAAGAAFETRSAAAGASATAVGTSTAAIRASTTGIASTVASTAAERPLEARTRIAADARGVAREIFTGRCWTANTWRPSFAGEENRIFFDGRRAFYSGLARGCRDHFLFDMLDLGVLVLDVFMLAVLVLAMCCVVFGVLLSHVRGEFRPVGRASRFDFLGFFLGEFRNFSGRCFFCFFRSFFGLLFRLFFVEFGAAGDGVGFRFCGGFFVFGLHEVGGERRNLVFT